MFVPRSTRRIRLARTAFVLAVVGPTAVIVAWAVHRTSAAHRDAVLRGWEAAVGLPLTAAALDHPLPGVVRLRDCTLAAADGDVVLEAGCVTMETSPTEVRLAIDALACGPRGAAALAGLAGEWLERGARFRRDVVIDVARFAWEVPGADGAAERIALGAVRIECVAQGDARAVRAVRREAAAGADEVRIVRLGDAGAVAGGRLEVTATCSEPLPWPILAAVAGGDVAVIPLGEAATMRGWATADRVAGRWNGTAAGRVERVDLRALTAALPFGAAGSMVLELERIEWREGRLATVSFQGDAAAGRVDRRLLDALVSTIGCRLDAGSPAVAPDAERAFEAAAFEVTIDGRGILVRGSGRLDGALAVADGRPLLVPPVGLVPPERVAWLLAPPGAVYVPSSGPGARLLSLLPQGGDPAGRTSWADPDGAERDF